MITVRPRRSVLYMPGSNPRALEKARTLDADGLILDLEDAVAPEAKEMARILVADAVRAGGYGRREILIRINAPGTPWSAEDLRAVAGTGVDGIVLPKVETPETLVRAEVGLRELGAPVGTALWAMVETPKGVLAAAEIAAATPRLAGLIMGTSDLAKDLRAAHTAMRLPMLTALGFCLLAARAAGIAILDGVHLDLADDEGFAAACRQGRELGFDGKTLIHPKTIEAANAIFAPSAEDVARALRIVEAHDLARAEGRGIAVVDGRLIEGLHVAEAERTIALAKAIGMDAGNGR